MLAFQKLIYDIPAIIAGIIGSLVLSTFIIIFVVMFIKRRQHHLIEIKELQHSYEQTLLSSQLEIQEQTLRHISEEIHDNIGQVLSLAKLQLNTLPSPPKQENQEGMNHTKKLLTQAIADLRDLGKSLNTERVDEVGLEENIRHELERLEKTRVYKTQLHINGRFYVIPIQVQTILFRMVQESINNIIKHADATIVEIVMDYNQDKFCLTINDDGIGISDAVMNSKENGIGLKNMRNRSGVIGAAFEIRSRIDGGTSVQVCLPKQNIRD